MKNLELQNFGVVEMNTEEMKETNGGEFFMCLAIIGIVAVAVSLIRIAYDTLKQDDCIE